MQLSGNSINLVCDDYNATIVTMGGAVASLRYMGHHIIMPFKPDVIPAGHMGKVLAPWPDRLVDGRYLFENKYYQVPVDDIENMTANHGLVAWKEWHISSISPTALVLKTYVSPIYGYPFLIDLSVNYEVINGMGLKVDITATNIGKIDAPYGVGMHPYLTCEGETIDTCRLTMPYKEVYTLNERKIADRLVPVDDLGFNFTSERVIGDTQMDHTFASPDATHMNTVLLENRDLKVYCKTNAPYMQIFTPPFLNRKFLAVAPMSCPSNAFNNGTGLIVLKPRQYHTLTYIIGALKQVV